MKLLDEIRKVLIADEGVVYEIYLDHLGYPTFGIGHLVKKDDPEYNMDVGTVVSKDRVMEAFASDMSIAIEETMRLVDNFNEHPQPVQIVLISLVFQLGFSRARKFKRFIKAVNNKDYIEAGRELKDSKLYHQTQARTERHIERLEHAARNTDR